MKDIRTRSGRSPEEYFESARAPSGRRRAVLTIGISGSGKSHWAQAASPDQWKIVQSDSLRVSWLEEARTRGEKLMVGGSYVEPNPCDENQVFSQELRERVMNLDFLLRQVDPTRGVLFDITNLTLQRVPLMMRLLAAGFEVEALVFEPQSLDVHCQNVQMRYEIGEGLKVERPIIATLLASYRCFCEILKSDATLMAPSEYELQALEALKIDFTFMRKNFPSFQAYLAQIGREERDAALLLNRYDVFHSVDYVEVQPYFQAVDEAVPAIYSPVPPPFCP